MKNFLRLLSYSKRYLPMILISMFSMLIFAVSFVAFTSVVQPLFDDVLMRVEKDGVMQPGESIENHTAISSENQIEQSPPTKDNALTLANKFFKLDKLIGLEGKNLTLIQLPIIIVFLFLLRGLSGYLGGYLMSKAGQSVVMDLRVELYEKICNRPLSFFTVHSTGTIISRVMNDVERIRSAVSEKVADIAREGFTLIGLIIYVFYLNWRLTLITFGSAWIVIFFIAKLGSMLRRFSTTSQEQTADMTTVLHESVTGIRIVKAFVMEKFEIARFKRAARELLTTNLRAAKVVMITPSLMEFIGAIMMALMVYYGGLQIQKGNLTAGSFLTFLVAIYGMYTPIKKLSRVNNVIQEAMAAAARVFFVLDMRTEIKEKEGAPSLKPMKKYVEYRNVGFGYRDEPVLEDASLRVEKGNILAIVGSSGAGKSTLVNLLPRFYDVSRGDIFIDGESIKDITLDSLRAQIGMVTQEVILFNDTVANNIAYGQDDVPMQKIEKAARVANAHDFIVELPQKYDTIIGEKGITLSGGQRQRLAIARAILKNPPILILDEATSALDSESEILVQKAINRLMKNRTTFVIAHRLSTVRNADQIIVLRKGRIVESGQHDELMRLNGEYTRLYNLQFRNGEGEEKRSS